MVFDRKAMKLIYILIVLIVIAVNAAVIWVYILEKSPCSSFFSHSDRCIDLPGFPDQNYSIFSPVHMLMKDDEEFKDVPINTIPLLYDPIIPVKYNSSDGSFYIEEVFGDEYSFDYYPDASGDNMTLNNTPDFSVDNLTVTYSPDVELNGNRFSFDILIINYGNEDIEISNVSVKYRIEQLNGQCDIKRLLMSDYTPDVLIHPREYSEIKTEVILLSPDEAENSGVCKYFNPDIWYLEDNLIAVTKKGSPYSYATNVRFKITSIY